MRCTEFEVRLCEYLDGRLELEVCEQIDRHAAECAACGALLAESRSLAGFLERVPAVEAPEALVTDILYRTQKGSAAWRAVWGGWWQSLLEPRFAMSMAMTILSVSMLYTLTGVQVRQVQAADLNPVALWRGVRVRAERAWQRGAQIYQNVRLLYEIQSQLPPLSSEPDSAGEAPPNTNQEGQR